MIRPIGNGVNNQSYSLAATLLASLCLLLINQFAWANFTATVDRKQISEADVLGLNLLLENQTIAIQPDFSPLKNDFEILDISGPNQNTSITIVNGRRSQASNTTWKLHLRAKRLGTLIIPSMTIANFQTQPISIKVVAQSAAHRRQSEQYVFLETEVDRDKIYVQGELLYTLRLYYRENLTGAISTLEIKNAIVETLEAEKRYEEIRAGQRFFVLEQQYAVYPQSSGTLTIPKQTFSGARAGRGFFSRSEAVMALSDQHSIRVLPKPAAFTAPDWLPAKALTLKQSWSATPPKFIVGEPINRTLTIEASGVTANMLPEFKKLNISGAKVYPDPATDTQVTSNKGLQSTRSITIGIVPTQVGTLVLAAINIPWWNTESNQMEFATIPASSFQVQAAAATYKTEILGATTRLDQIPTEAGTEPATTAETTASHRPWQYAVVVFLLLWLGTLYLYFRHPKSRNIASAEITKIDQTQQVNARQLFNQLKLACAQNDAPLAHKLLLGWVKIRFPELSSIHQLSSAKDPTLLRDEVRSLEQYLYGSDTNSDWRGNKLAEILLKLDNEKVSPSKHQSLQQSLVPS